MRLWILAIGSLAAIAAVAYPIGVSTVSRLANTEQQHESTTELGACPVSTAVVASDPGQSPQSPARRDPLGTGPWFRSPDGKIWAPADKAGSPVWGMKQIWLKPVGSRLEVHGRRLDAEAPPMKASVPCCYPGDFQALGLAFPSDGCWEVEGRADGSVLQFVVKVSGTPDFSASGSCLSLAEAVRASVIIMVAHVEGTEGDRAKFVWQTARGHEIVKAPEVADPAHYPYDPAALRVIFPQSAQREPVLAQGRFYLLFLPRLPDQLRCPRQTLAGVMHGQDGPQVVPLTPDSFWQPSSLAEVASEIRAAAGQSTIR